MAGVSTLPPIIFIIGPPRSGSTLFFQTLLSAFDFGYFTNRHARWFGGISYYEWLFRPLRPREKIDFTSEHGRTEGALGPNECGDYWYQFFPRFPHFVDEVVESRVDLDGLRNSLARIRVAFGKPLLIKNLNCGLRLRTLAKVVPDARFIVIHRDRAAMGHSLLEGRKRVSGDYHTWWSMEPSNIDDLRTLEPVDQVLGQCRQVYADIEEGKGLFSPDQFLDVHYESLCENPKQTVERLSDWLVRGGVEVGNVKGVLPASFSERREVRIPRELWDQLREKTGA